MLMCCDAGKALQQAGTLPCTHAPAASTAASTLNLQVYNRRAPLLPCPNWVLRWDTWGACGQMQPCRRGSAAAVAVAVAITRARPALSREPPPPTSPLSLDRRQRQLINLGLRVPTTAPDTWVAPNAVVVGDVDLYDKVCWWWCCSFVVCFVHLCSGGVQLCAALGAGLEGTRGRGARRPAALQTRAPARPGPALALVSSPTAAPSARTTTHCPLQPQTSIWYGCVLRGDLNSVSVGAFSNVQDRTVITAAR